MGLRGLMDSSNEAGLGWAGPGGLILLVYDFVQTMRL